MVDKLPAFVLHNYENGLDRSDWKVAKILLMHNNHLDALLKQIPGLTCKDSNLTD